MIYHTQTHLAQVAQENLDVNFISGKVNEYVSTTQFWKVFFGV